MKKEHTQFITGLLANPRLSINQKDKLIELALRDFSKNGAEEKILNDLRLIKEKIGLENSDNSEEDFSENWSSRSLTDAQRAEFDTSNENTKKNVDLITKWGAPEMSEEALQDVLKLLNDKRTLSGKSNLAPKNISANPKHVADFMAQFNQRKGLKYLTHDYDENNDFDIEKFLSAASQVFKEKTKILKIPPSLWQIVNQFAFDSEQTEWTSISEDYKKSVPISTGWASKELRDWSKQNRLHPIRHKEYKKIIDAFKRITRIESSSFPNLIDIALENGLKKDIESFEIKKIDLQKADFYSHVTFLKTALETIFEEIKKRSDSPNKRKISIKYERSISEDYYLRKIIITHHNSFPSKELQLLLQEWKEKGNMGKIKRKLNGYCHWSVETLIEENPVRVNILRENNIDEYEKIEQAPDGFRHILTFYYK